MLNAYEGNLRPEAEAILQRQSPPDPVRDRKVVVVLSHKERRVINGVGSGHRRIVVDDCQHCSTRSSQTGSYRFLQEKIQVLITARVSVVDYQHRECLARLANGKGQPAGFLHKGGRNQQPGTDVYNKELTARKAAALSASN